jgi:hypothetical protein
VAVSATMRLAGYERSTLQQYREEAIRRERSKDERSRASQKVRPHPPDQPRPAGRLFGRWITQLHCCNPWNIPMHHATATDTPGG